MNKHIAIYNTHKNVVSIIGDKCLDKSGNEVHIDEATVEEEFLRLNKDSEKINYKFLRSSKYPSIGDQLDALFKAGVFPEEMAAKIQAVKDKYPKG